MATIVPVCNNRQSHFQNASTILSSKNGSKFSQLSPEIFSEIFANLFPEDWCNIYLLNKYFCDFYYHVLHLYFRPRRDENGENIGILSNYEKVKSGKNIVKFLNSEEVKNVRDIYRNGNNHFDSAQYCTARNFYIFIKNILLRLTKKDDLLNIAKHLLRFDKEFYVIKSKITTLQSLVDLGLFIFKGPVNKGLVNIKTLSRLNLNYPVKNVELNPYTKLSSEQRDFIIYNISILWAQAEPLDIVSFMQIPPTMLKGGLIGACIHSDRKYGEKVMSHMLKSNGFKRAHESAWCCGADGCKNPIFWAANFRKDLIEEFIKSGIKITEIDTKYHIDKIFFIVENGDVELLKILIRCGLNKNAEDEYGKTILHVAVRHEASIPIAKYLIKIGADLYKQEYGARGRGNAPLHSLLQKLELEPSENIKKIYMEFVRFAVENSIRSDIECLNIKNEDGNTLLHLALKARILPVMSLHFINEGLNINVQNNDGDTPLHIICKMLQEKIGEELKQAYIKIADQIMKINSKSNTEYLNMQNKKGNTLLHIALLDAESPLIIQRLIEAGARLDVQNKVGDMPLHTILKTLQTMRKGTLKLPMFMYLEKIRTLTELAKQLTMKVSIQLGKEYLNIQNVNGATPLYLASEIGDVNLMRYLQDAGAK